MVDHALKENRIVSLESLHPHPQNYRSHPDEQVSDLVASLQRFGPTRSIVVQDGPDGYLIVAGHGLVEAAKKLQIKELRADIIPADWTPTQVKGYLVADNNLSNKSSDDETMLAELLQEQANSGYDLASLGTDDEALRQMLEALGDEYLGSGEQEDEEEDETPEVDEEQTRVQVGDVWQLGEKHVIGCLDATNAEHVKMLLDGKTPNCIIADPPYGVSVVKNNMVGADFGIAQKGKYAPIIGDETTATALAAYRLCADLYPHAMQVWWGANNYADALPPSNCWLVWDKRSDSGIENTFADCELAWTNMTGPSRVHHQLWNGMIREGEHEKRVHPTQKSCALYMWILDKFGKQGDVVFDPFLGSGVSVIAAENLGGRTVIGCELSPAYCEVVIRRWEAESGQDAHLAKRLEVAHA